jgi:dihydropteroate synthase
MGILNINEDSFYQGSRFTQSDTILKTAERMLAEGAAILDIGGMSSRPGAAVIDAEEELRRVLPAIENIHREFPEAILSIDTIRSKVAREAVHAGAAMINDISAGRLDDALYPTLAELQVPYVLMHMQKRPENMQEAPLYENVVQEVLDFLIFEIATLRKLGLKDILIDPGFGFGKSIEHNYEILRSLHVFQMLDVPILAGLSRKSMIYKPLGLDPEHALNGTSALHMVALQQGAKVLRAHDIAPAIEVIKLWQMTS